VVKVIVLGSAGVAELSTIDGGQHLEVVWARGMSRTLAEVHAVEAAAVLRDLARS
jgi:hypothetical protein